MSRTWKVSSTLFFAVFVVCVFPLLAQGAVGEHFASKVFPQTNGKIVFLGGVGNGASKGRTFRTYLARVDSSGRIDPTYGNDGFRFIPKVDAALDGASCKS